MVNGVFSIPLEIIDSPLSKPGDLRSTCHVVLREYIGSEENQLVQFAFDALQSGTQRYNPIVLCGPTGTGKTLLAEGLVDYWRNSRAERSVYFQCGADFARAYSNAVDTNSLPEFVEQILRNDLFVLDDLDELRNKQAAQQQFVLILDELMGAGSTVLLTSRHTVSIHPNLTSMLVSRLAAGLTVPLLPPGLPARRMLLRRLADIHQISISDSALDMLAKNLNCQNGQSTVPELNHALVQLAHDATTNGTPIDVATISSYLGDQKSHRSMTLRRIAEHTARCFSVSAEKIRSPSRRRGVVRARGVAMLLSRKLTNKSLKAIGEYYGKRDHTTVLHACRKTAQMQEFDSEISNAIDQLIERLQSR